MEVASLREENPNNPMDTLERRFLAETILGMIIFVPRALPPKFEMLKYRPTRKLPELVFVLMPAETQLSDTLKTLELENEFQPMKQKPVVVMFTILTFSEKVS
jgi:hypothetical protein